MFLRDVVLGSPQARAKLEHRIQHLAMARELAYRTLVLNRCARFREMAAQARFDAFAEAILQGIGSSDPQALTVFTADDQLRMARMQNTLTAAQIGLIRRIMDSPRYADFVEYLSFESAETEIAAGFMDPSTGQKAPWMAAAALAYLRQSRFFLLLLADVSAADRALLQSHKLDGTRPSDLTAVDDGYLQALTALFERQLESASLRKKSLPKSDRCWPSTRFSTAMR
ncbi:hypothetical protein [Comamonas endophytica]|uniref:Uncharacterized protein n=1 Tax=Comamonas endophytica TaxID=2949090 RepID=A0ABY6GFV5_9BURK|nr:MULTISPECIES: hypothetical protein [unclassified Acidovorax]MCD2513326.1 hypothetical protein [Acidovorax sp. D4N7]UYG53889.1 hypothetical protein M9799_18320 [Acidovorax sp. 5MLIR]